jgi:hypothetical protein
MRVGGQRHASAAFATGKDPVPIFTEYLNVYSVLRLLTTRIEVYSVVQLLCQTHFIYDSSDLLACYIVQFKFNDVSGVSGVHIITVCPHSPLPYRSEGGSRLL